MKIAIQGHRTRGKEVIKILESLGGINSYNHSGSNPACYYELHGNTIVCACTQSSSYKYYILDEFEKEFPLKVGDIILLKRINKPCEIIALEYFNNKLCYKLDDGYHYDPKTLTPYKEMQEERNITLTLDKAKEWYKKGGELKEIALQAFTENELVKHLPKTWKEFCKNYPIQDGECWLASCDEIYEKGPDEKRLHRNWIPSKKSAEAHLAMIQLEQLRNCWRQGWEPDWDNLHQTKYCIGRCRGKVKIYTLFETSDFLCFPTEEMAKEFFECFRDLIEKAGDLI